MKKGFIPLILVMVFAFIMAGCSSSPAATTNPATSNPITSQPSNSNPVVSPVQNSSPPAAASAQKRGGVFRFIQTTSNTTPGGWPAEMSMDESICYEGLVTQNVKAEVEPLLAESWDIAQDKSSITFHLKKGVKFTDGSDFNAEVVKFMFDAQIASKKAANWSSVEIIDNYTVKVNIIKWKTTTLSSFGDGGVSFIASKAAYDKNGVDWLRQNPTGTSAFMFKSFTRDESYKLVRNPNYWGAPKPYIDELDMITITDEMTQKSAMQAGEGDATVVELGKQTADMKAMGLNVDSIVQAVFCLVPDTANPDSPWSNPLVRQAAEYAIDKESIAAGMGYGLWQAPYQITPRSYQVYNPDFSKSRKFSVVKAKELLKQAGYSEGFNTTMIPFPGATSKDVTQAVQKYLADVGIKCEVQYMDYGKYASIRDGGWTNGILFDPIPAYANYMQTLNTVFSIDGWMWYKSWLRTPEYIAAYNAADTTLAPDINLIRKVTDVIYDQATLISVYEGGKSYAYQPYVKDAGFLTRAFPIYWNTKNVWLDK